MANLWAKIKDSFGWIATVAVGIVGFLLYFLQRKEDEVSVLKSQIKLANTQKESDILESQINKLKNSKDLSKKQVEQVDSALQELEEKRKMIRQGVIQETDPEKIADYWNNN